MIHVRGREIFIGALVVILTGTMTHAVLEIERGRAASPEPEFAGSWACVAEVNVCPDGSYVGRVPPYCHFAACGD